VAVVVAVVAVAASVSAEGSVSATESSLNLELAHQFVDGAPAWPDSSQIDDTRVVKNGIPDLVAKFDWELSLSCGAALIKEWMIHRARTPANLEAFSAAN
jgi:hypothetical protein